MEELLPITNINDFLFCPRSLYFGSIYRRSLNKDCFQAAPQKKGSASHERLDTQTYSTKKNIITGMMVVCSSFGLIGCIDCLDMGARTLIERKTYISTIWDGMKMQLYAQFWALQEMGYAIEVLKLHSLKDNKTYDISLPSLDDRSRMERIISDMREFKLENTFIPNPRKCRKCIYADLCDMN